jgi:hypothetical protein
METFYFLSKQFGIVLADLNNVMKFWNMYLFVNTLLCEQHYGNFLFFYLNNL